MQRCVSTINLIANVTMTVRDAKTGIPILVDRKHNRVVFAGCNAIRDALAGVRPSIIVGWFAVGTGDTPATDLDTGLESEIWRDAVTRIDTDEATAQVDYYLPTTAANGYTLTEAGLFLASSGGPMLVRVVMAPQEKNENITITYTWDIGIGAA
jgi:hypothetical protein